MKARDWALPIGVIAALLAGYFAFRYFTSRAVESVPPELPSSPSAVVPNESSDAAPRPPQYPVPASETAAHPELPALADSDPALREGLIEIFQNEPVEAFLVPMDIVRRFVVMVDNLTEPSLPMRLRPIRKIGGAFMVQSSDQEFALSAANAARYAGFVEALQLADTRLCVRLYLRYYALFQSAYEELGHRTYFNDRLVAVIDHLLATPEVQGPLLLVRPKVFYDFADPALQSRSAGQKVLLRIGSENADVIKDKLRELRAALVNFDAQQPAP